MLIVKVLKYEKSTYFDILLPPFEKLLKFEQNKSEYNVFSNTSVYRRLKYSYTIVQILIYRDNIYFNPHIVHIASVIENSKVEFTTAY